MAMLKSLNDRDYADSVASSVLTRAVRKAGSPIYWLKWQGAYSPCTAAEKARLEILNRLEKKTAK